MDTCMNCLAMDGRGKEEAVQLFKWIISRFFSFLELLAAFFGVYFFTPIRYLFLMIKANFLNVHNYADGRLQSKLGLSLNQFLFIFSFLINTILIFKNLRKGRLLRRFKYESNDKNFRIFNLEKLISNLEQINQKVQQKKHEYKSTVIEILNYYTDSALCINTDLKDLKVNQKAHLNVISNLKSQTKHSIQQFNDLNGRCKELTKDFLDLSKKAAVSEKRFNEKLKKKSDECNELEQQNTHLKSELTLVWIANEAATQELVASKTKEVELARSFGALGVEFENLKIKLEKLKRDNGMVEYISSILKKFERTENIGEFINKVENYEELLKGNDLMDKMLSELNCKVSELKSSIKDKDVCMTKFKKTVLHANNQTATYKAENVELKLKNDYLENQFKLREDYVNEQMISIAKKRDEANKIMSTATADKQFLMDELTKCRETLKNTVENIESDRQKHEVELSSETTRNARLLSNVQQLERRLKDAKSTNDELKSSIAELCSVLTASNIPFNPLNIPYQPQNSQNLNSQSVQPPKNFVQAYSHLINEGTKKTSKYEPDIPPHLLPRDLYNRILGIKADDRGEDPGLKLKIGTDDSKSFGSEKPRKQFLANTCNVLPPPTHQGQRIIIPPEKYKYGPEMLKNQRSDCESSSQKSEHSRNEETKEKASKRIKKVEFGQVEKTSSSSEKFNINSFKSRSSTRLFNAKLVGSPGCKNKTNVPKVSPKKLKPKPKDEDEEGELTDLEMLTMY